MDKWEYLAVYISLADDLRDKKGLKYKDWVTKFSDGTRVEGMNQVLDYFGTRGWELASMVPEYISSYPGGTQAESYRAVFKRKVQE